MSYRLHYAKAGEAFIHVSLVPSTPLPAPQVLVVPRAIPRRAFRIEELPLLVESATSVDTRDVFGRWLGPMPARR